MKRTAHAFSVARTCSILLSLKAMALSAVACIPSAANLQSARTMDEGQTRITPYATSTQVRDSRDDDNGEHVSDNFGILVGIGGRGGAETQIRFEQYRIDNGDSDEDGLLHFCAFGPKFELAENVLAVAVPMGIYMAGNPLMTLQFHPGLMATIPAGRYLEINTAGKIIIPVASPQFSWLSFNLGASVSSDVARWAIIPEVSYVTNVQAQGAGFVSYGVGVAFYRQ